MSRITIRAAVVFALVCCMYSAGNAAQGDTLRLVFSGGLNGEIEACPG